MKAYVLVNPVNNRLLDNKIPTYPSCLPDYKIINGFTASMNIDTPGWFRESYGERQKRHYCALLGHIRGILSHYDNYPDEELLVMEDDVVFEPKFDEYYRNFMKMVPDDWDAIYFGGWFSSGVPKEVVPNVLSARNCMLHGAECILLSPKLVAKLHDKYSHASNEIRKQFDNELAHWAKKGYINSYKAIGNMAHQAIGFSAISQRLTDHNCVRYSTFNYIDINNEPAVASAEDLKRYEDK